MTQEPTRAPSLRLLGRAAALMGVCLGLVVVLAALYALAPEPSGDAAIGQVVVVGLLGLVAYLGLTLWAALQLATAKRPILQGSLLVTIMATVIILGYSWVYLGLSINDPSSFTEPLNKSSAVYFTVTVLATVGFGDIAPTDDTTRMVVTSQMLLGITLITVGIRLIVQSARQAAASKHLLLPGEPGSA